MKNVVFVDIDTERTDTPILIGHTNEITRRKESEQVIDDMATLCEGVCTLIHWAEDKGFKSSATSLRDCIQHLEKGFTDATYKTRTNGE